MNKFTKTLIVLGSLVMVVLFGVLALTYADQAFLPPELEVFMSHLRLAPIAQLAIAPYVFWLAVAMIAIFLILILVTIFFPRLYTEVELEDGHSGTLNLKKSALEGFVKTIVQEEGLMASPNVTAKVYKHKFKINVAGKVIPRVGIPEKVERIEQDIRTGLEHFFGVTKNVEYSVSVKHIEPKKTSTSSRVE
ncbi:alkaline shock response membrane anchor protein AmaP [Streptococcus caprae]|uniref:Alkaline shock response membrane anchor protein AmaP n=1 Tax=Streptococcus caprae TaxID=1640501 RepID=A0ABV8CSV4_9STRE